LEPNKDRTAFHIPTDYARRQLLDWLKRFNQFSVSPVTRESTKGRRFLEGAVIVEYCWWQYGIDPREPNRDEERRFLFKRDFHYSIVKDRTGAPTRVPKSSLGQATAILRHYDRWAEENGGPRPNPDLYKLYRDEWKGDPRFGCFHDFLDFLGLECDAMPSR